MKAAEFFSDRLGVKHLNRDEVENCLFVMRQIGSMDAEDIDGDDVDLRFETVDGRDTGCDVSIVQYAELAASIIEAFLEGAEV